MRRSLLILTSALSLAATSAAPGGRAGRPGEARLRQHRAVDLSRRPLAEDLDASGRVLGTASAARGTPLAGKWNVKDGKVCMKQSKPPTLPVAYCTPFPDNTYVGVSWTSKDMSGTPIQLKVVKGMAEAKSEK